MRLAFSTSAGAADRPLIAEHPAGLKGRWFAQDKNDGLSSPFQSALVIGIAVAVAGAIFAAPLVTEIVGGTTLAGFMSQTESVIDPEVRAFVAAGRARVLVVLRVDENSDQDQRADALSRAQDAVLSRLTRGHASVVRRYTSVPMLALEIDATALRALETMTDLVGSVKLDRTVTPQ